MRIVRLACIIMARVSTLRSLQFVLLLAAALAVVAFYYFGSENQNFSSTTRRIKLSQANHNANRNNADLTLDTRFSQLDGSEEKETGESNAFQSKTRGDETQDQRYNILMMFTKVDKNRSLQDKFRVAMLSMVKYAQFLEGEVLVFHFVSDPASKELGEKMLQEFLTNATFKYEVLFHDVETFTHKLFPIVEALQKHFSAGSWAYYSDAIFFLSVAMHHILPENLTRIVQLDLDLKYRTNIRDLFKEFNHFPPGAVLGIAREMQPVYRHTFWQYRKENPETRVGDPPPEGLPGFNSGVMLLDLAAMRASALYNQLLDTRNVTKLADKYSVKGHLGDQDFFTMISMEHPELFYSLACGWNRQLCTWWRDHGYRDVFQLYYRCDGPIYIYHGNCNSPIPDD
ncbi:xyloside xylosyltransferase 1 [Corythoichthys intestinalis]|uniref:xyloside xylosyltransferase 1 n=1 Tax=Corythoichthys intestinalis TaxID=161448 RepID=UPI0025A5B78F|nr:xyloside xylosyltransferase 1 [Corythoichthys intestinalis]XP_057698139.1 xyloside xylosyltransferase 1 [Corythoichthys intestinalis]XP_061790865.1 xyloside xylosyltransferase 1 [Nerophis lumbriciformis]